jgi:TolB protein
VTGDAVRPIAPLPGSAVNPAFSPDGKRILFESDLAGSWDLWVMNRDGTGLRQLTTDRSSDRFGTWSPDGKKIAFSSDRSGNWDIWAMNLEGGPVKQLTDFQGLDIAPTWSPNGKEIAFVSSRTMDVLVWVMNEDGSGIHGMPNIRCGDWASSWSPDGRFIAAVSSMRGKSDIWLIDTQQRAIQQLTQKSEERRDFLPFYSPDGSMIAFVSERNGKRDIWIMDAEAKEEWRPSPNILTGVKPKYDVDREVYDGIAYLRLSWSPDGKELAFTRVKENGLGEIAVLPVVKKRGQMIVKKQESGSSFHADNPM